MEALYDISVQTIDGEMITLKRFKDNIMLIVNVASK
jgi:glutathione peroxidase-family protein